MLQNRWHSVKFTLCDSLHSFLGSGTPLCVTLPWFVSLWVCIFHSTKLLPSKCKEEALSAGRKLEVWQNLVHFGFDFSADFSLCWLWECGNLTTNFWCGDMFRIITIFIFILKILITVYYDISTAKNLLLLASSTEEQQKWVSRLVKKIPKKPPAPDPFARSSPRTSMKVQPNQSIRRPSRQLPPNKPRWHKSCYLIYCFKRFATIKDVYVDKDNWPWILLTIDIWSSMLSSINLS